jgi:hypothetical protein
MHEVASRSLLQVPATISEQPPVIPAAVNELFRFHCSGRLLRGKMLVHHGSARQARRFVRATTTLFAISIKPPALALACGLLAGCAATGTGSSPMAGDQNAGLKAGTAIAAPVGAGSPTAAALADPVLMQR